MLMSLSYKDILTDANNLYISYKRAKKCCNWKRSTIAYRQRWLLYLSKLQNALLNKTHKCCKCTYFTLNERGKIRYIAARGMTDKIVRHCLNDFIIIPAIDKYLIYDNGASRKGKGISFTRKRFEQHIRQFYYKYKTNKGYILLIDFSKYYDNIIHEKAKQQILSKLNKDNEYVDWLLTLILNEFKVDVSYMNDTQYQNCLYEKYNSLEYKSKNYPKLGQKYMYKSIDIGDQTSQSIGIFYLTKVDNYIKIVRSQKYYDRYMDDLAIISRTKEELQNILENIKILMKPLGLFINERKTHIFKLCKTFTFLQNKYHLTNTGKLIKRPCNRKIVDIRRKLKSLYIKVMNKELNSESLISLYKSWTGNYFKDMSKLQIYRMKLLYESMCTNLVYTN